MTEPIDRTTSSIEFRQKTMRRDYLLLLISDALFAICRKSIDPFANGIFGTNSKDQNKWNNA